MPSIPIKDDAHWHSLRAQHIGSSECAALFGEHAQLTPFELWNIKAGRLPAPDMSDNERVMWGTILEPAIAEGVRRKTGWTIKKVRRYYSRLPELGWGASLDFEILNHDKGPGILEIKTADWLVAKQWENGEPPIGYEVQVQHGLGACGRGWGCIGVLIGGNELRMFTYDKRPKTLAIIEAKVSAFWQSIRDGIEPKPDFGKDAASVASLYRATSPGTVIDLTDSNRFPALIAEYQEAAAAKRSGEKAADAAKAEIMMMVGEADIAICGEYQVKTSLVSGVPDKVISPEMVGTSIKGRKGYRGLWISARKEKAA